MKRGPVPRTRSEVILDIYNRLDMSGGPDACWPWTGSRDLDGYGRIVAAALDPTLRPIPVHRVICEHHYGPPPTAGHFALHSCDNPPCANPRHLWWGTHTDNMRDARAKGRKYQTTNKAGA